MPLKKQTHTHTLPGTITNDSIWLPSGCMCGSPLQQQKKKKLKINKTSEIMCVGV